MESIFFRSIGDTFCDMNYAWTSKEGKKGEEKHFKVVKASAS